MIHTRFNDSDLRYLYASIRRKQERKEQRKEFFEALFGALLCFLVMYALIWLTFFVQQIRGN